jgi:hypothetical protein
VVLNVSALKEHMLSHLRQITVPPVQVVALGWWLKQEASLGELPGPRMRLDKACLPVALKSRGVGMVKAASSNSSTAACMVV